MKTLVLGAALLLTSVASSHAADLAANAAPVQQNCYQQFLLPFLPPVCETRITYGTTDRSVTPAPYTVTVRNPPKKPDDGCGDGTEGQRGNTESKSAVGGSGNYKGTPSESKKAS